MSKRILDQQADDDKPLPIYEIVHRIQLENGDWTWRPLEAGEATEAELKRIRQKKVDPFYPNRRMVVVWPLQHGRASNGLSGTLEGWMKGQRG